MIPRRRYNIEAGFFNDALTGRLAPSRMRAFVPRFEAALAASLGGRHSVQATGSGRKALATLLDTLGIPKGSTIMIPAYTLGDIGPFLGRLGYRWITCDVDPGRPVMTAATVLDAWPSGGDVKCVLATHLFGIPADVPAIAKAVEPFHATVIEDCAQSIGSTLGGAWTGTLSRGAIFSFNYLKPVNCFGGGAMVLPGHREMLPLKSPPRVDTAGSFARGLAEDLVSAGPWLRLPTALLAFDQFRPTMMMIDRMIRRPPDTAEEPCSISPLQALHGIHSLASLERRLALRRLIARRLCEAAEIDDGLYREDSPARSNAYFFTIRVADAPAFRRELWMQGIDAGIGAEVADYLESPVCPERPAAMGWFREAVQLPCHEWLTPRQVERIVAAIRQSRDCFRR
ncbi:MAG TPA: DegT/DnrJ/EryC1/StrS family aminotransferase [Myxococcota bacterium]|nr:DegT/DnrJ/EryC1/StrS family aminotransferase [Myxococcota bacterium]HOC99028.1 DegT/DnrJ/EryC1/StrS family aminotransferase [Myxococcota bacterium]HOH76872.1 DegT/DnrJ/EryC1/StrS family aminotransferase [Myxococcota bacterium]HPV03748.1 DegT/DnrJ/EryC1/StrS family aminotransferase [Myxococcota bacterium]